MTTLQIVLLVIGLICLVGSFFVSEKLSSSDLKEMKKMSQQEIKLILDAEMGKAQESIEAKIQDTLDSKMEEMERKSDKETNEKILSISEYSDTVLNSMNKSHQEIVFMYDMLNDKQEKMTLLTKELQEMESSVVQMQQALDEKLLQIQEETQRQIELSKEELPQVVQEQELSVEEVLQQQIKEQEEEPGDNEKILTLYKQGLSEVEIAKKLGRGLGEVKLILGLFSEEGRV